MKKPWERAPLDEAVFLQEGPGIRSYEYQKGGYPMINVRCVQDGYIDLSTCNAANVELATGKWKHFQVQEGDILFTISGSIGRTAIVKKQDLPLLMNTSVVRFRSKTPRLRDDFYFYYLQSEDFLGKLHALSSGTAQKNVGPTHLKTLDVPLPPLAEQQRIVGLLDEAFEGLATAKANAEKNLQNARALFESHLQSVFTQRGPGWVEKSVKEIAAPAKGSIRTGPFGSQLLHSEFVDEGIAVLGIDNAVANEFRWGKSRFITPEKYRQLERYTVHPGDVLITIMGTCGRCAIVPDDIPTAINTKHICCITLDRKQCLPGYLHIYFLHAPQSQEFLAKHAKGAIMAGLNMGLIQDLPVMLPPTKVQAAIVEAADDLREETQRLARLYERKLAALEALKKSLLHQAFAGEL